MPAGSTGLVSARSGWPTSGFTAAAVDVVPPGHGAAAAVLAGLAVEADENADADADVVAAGEPDAAADAGADADADGVAAAGPGAAGDAVADADAVVAPAAPGPVAAAGG